jgi:hypothetical protein
MLPYYKNLQNEDRTYILSFLSKDPTWNEKKESGQYSKWILDKLNRKIIDKGILGHLGDLLKRFEDNKKQLKDKDINKFKTPEDLETYLNDDDNYTNLSHRQEVRQRQKDRHNVDLNNEATLVYEDNDWEVWVPKTYAASCKLGQGTSWCTASTETSDYFDEYTDDGQLYININKHNPKEKYQFHFETESFMDKEDEEIDIEEFFVDNPILYKKVYSDYYEFDIDDAAKQLFELKKNNYTYYYNGFEIRKSIRNKIKQVIVLDNVISIDYGAFYGCTSLTSITIPNSVTSIDYRAFYDCRLLTNIQIPDSVTSIGSGTFEECSSLASIEIPAGVTSICNSAFSGCSSLTSVTIPDSITSIGWYAFSHCSSLTSVVIPDSVTSISSYAFEYSSLTSITIPDSVESIGSYAFRNCHSLTSIVIPNSVESIGEQAFYNCSSLTIYCEAESKPDGWESVWNYSNCPVVWGYKGNKTNESF